ANASTSGPSSRPNPAPTGAGGCWYAATAPAVNWPSTGATSSTFGGCCWGPVDGRGKLPAGQGFGRAGRTPGQDVDLLVPVEPVFDAGLCICGDHGRHPGPPAEPVCECFDRVDLQ